MVRYLLDIATYQGALTLADVVRAEFQVVNFKTSHGLGQSAVHPRLSAYVAEAKTLKLGISTFHWLIGNHSGTDQARYAYSRLRALGLADTAAHCVDVEESTGTDDKETAPTWQVIRDYVGTMQALMRRPIMLYTGDWWWQSPGRGWNGAGLTPYLMAAPNDGYPGRYPGDTSSQWRAGYGGWMTLACMQYAVQPLTFPGGGKGTIDVSKAVIRNEAIWRALTTPTGDDLVTTQAEFNGFMTGYLATPAGKAAMQAIVTAAVGPQMAAVTAQLSTSMTELAQSLSAIPEAVARELTEGSNEEVAGKLRDLLGDRAGDVAAILTGGRS